MSAVNKKLLVPVIAVLLLIPLARGFGSVQKSDTVSIKPGYPAKFEILFYNLGQEPISLNLKTVSAPKGWRVEMPPEVVVSPTSIVENPQEGEYLKVTGGYIRPEIVEAMVRTPWDQSRGKYKIKIKAIRKRPADVGQGENITAVVQERVFKFTVEVEGDEYEGPQEEGGVVPVSSGSKNQTGEDTDQEGQKKVEQVGKKNSTPSQQNQTIQNPPDKEAETGLTGLLIRNTSLPLLAVIILVLAFALLKFKGK